MNLPPCKKNGQDCPRRHPGCQTDCPDLAGYYKKQEVLKKAQDREALANAATKAAVRRMSMRNPAKRAEYDRKRKLK